MFFKSGYGSNDLYSASSDVSVTLWPPVARESSTSEHREGHSSNHKVPLDSKLTGVSDVGVMEGHSPSHEALFHRKAK